jgi:putative methanogenesis marker protein 8
MPKKKDRHVMEALGKTRVVVENGKVVEVGQPQTDYCPIFAKVRNIRQFTPESVRGNIEFRIEDFGMFTGRREIEMEIFVGFGASETFMTALRRGLLDSCVTACEGAGTVITSSPTLAQGIGSRISGLVETTPIPELIWRIEEVGGTVLDPGTAALDQVAGVEKAIEMGYMRIGVSVVCAPDVMKIRELEKQHDVEVITFGVHVTGMGEEEAKEFISLVDITTGCTSRHIREQIKGHALAQFGTAIPIFAITQRGKEMLLERAKEVTDPILINTMKLPVLPEEKQPRPLI